MKEAQNQVEALLRQRHRLTPADDNDFTVRNLAQFLVEAVTLAALGGVLGIAAGVGSSVLISYLAGWTTHTSLDAILIAFAFSALVGVFFGYYPARRAALLNPIEALHHE